MNGQQTPDVQAFIDEAFAAAQQVQQRARELQQESAVQPRAPVQTRVPFWTAGNLFWLGLGGVSALGLAYILIKRGD